MRARFTKEDYKYIVENWGKKSTFEMAEELGVGADTIRGVAFSLRKKGVKLSKLERRVILTDSLVEELKKINEKGKQNNE